MTIIARRVSSDPADDGLTAVIERIHARLFYLRYWPRNGEPTHYHECAVISDHRNENEARSALDVWAA